MIRVTSHQRLRSRYRRRIPDIKSRANGFRVASEHAACKCWDLLHIDLKTALLQGKTYSERRIIHVQLPSNIRLQPYLVGLCTRSVYGLADAPCRWWIPFDKFSISLGLEQTRADIGSRMYVMMEHLRMMTCPKV